MKKIILHKAVYSIIRAIVRPYIRHKYRFTTDMIPDLKEPYLMLSNHTTEEDMLFTGTAGRKHMYFVCGEHLLRNRVYGKPLRILADPIAVPKGGATLSAVKEILNRLKAGFNVCMFPEGKRSFHGETIPSPESLGKLVKMAGCALVTYRIRGGYFTYPRWARDNHRKGHAEGKVVGIYSPDQLKEMTAKEITDIINRDTYENAYETQRREQWIYTGKNRAEGLEKVLFICPSCGGMDTISTDGDAFSCTCGLRGVYDDYGFLKGEKLPFDNVLSWMRWIEPEYDRFVSRHGEDDLLFTEQDVLLYQMLDNYQNESILTGTLHVFNNRMTVEGTGSSEDKTEPGYEFCFRDISALSILYGNILLFTYKGKYYGLTGDSFRAWKCGRLWHLTKGDTDDRTKEM
ncbi:MAG: 1-acyl-sn-glycerol-3-phosphate acyltransferase [Synergistes sp.]|nr:1-acyl-sn-glycerol-3-phosphate acyltransferase [Synergistes sp.]